MVDENAVIPVERIENIILFIRGQKVLLDKDLADLYGVETRSLVQAIKRNMERFPSDFMFQLTQDEFDSLRSQIVISKGRGGRRYLPYAFTEQRVAMLSSTLRSKRAIQVNVAIMRAFVKLREVLSTHKKLEVKLSELERKIENHDESIQTIFEALRQLMKPPEKPGRKIGFDIKKRRAAYGKRAKKG
ncbi:MAG: ORF6N domain-containing protein [Desulfobacterales bacterium]|nr:ORF6N domain-containing protein [Desulfobacterales bacterium]